MSEVSANQNKATPSEVQDEQQKAPIPEDVTISEENKNGKNSATSSKIMATITQP